MWKSDLKRNLGIFLKAGLPFTLAGMAVVFGGIHLLRKLFAGSEYQSTVLFLWLALFWLIYQPLFRRRLRDVGGRSAGK